MRYVALLRGINVGGKNKVDMKALKACFEAAGLKDVSTYINSGNVFFTSPIADTIKLINLCQKTIEQKFGFNIVCCVVSQSELKAALNNAPAWWDQDKTAKNNALFIIPPKTPAEIMQEVGAAKPDYEQIASSGPVIFWTAPLETFSKTRYSKVVSTKVYQFITIRNANTTKKLLELL